jgi:outer membrane protein TolC
MMLGFGAAAASASDITETEFLSRLTGDHPAVLVLRDEMAEAEGERKTPRTENPAVGFEREAPDGAAPQNTLVLSWRPPLDGRRGLANDAAEAGLAAANLRFDWERLQLRARLRELFANWSLATERQRLFAGLAERTQQLAARARARADTGAESGLSARRLELAAAEVRSALAVAEVDRVAARALVTAMFPALGSDRSPVPPALPEASEPFTAFDRSDLHAREADVEHADFTRRLGGRWIEFPTLFGGWTVIEEDGMDLDGPVWGLEWNLPLFDRRQGERARADREIEVARARLDLERARATAELEAAQQAYESLRIAVEDVADLTDGTEAVVEAATAEFEAGESGLTDLLETVRSATDSRLAALELYGQALAAHRQLELSVGRPLTEESPR